MYAMKKNEKANLFKNSSKSATNLFFEKILGAGIACKKNRLTFAPRFATRAAKNKPDGSFKQDGRFV
ncbi:hypothetical protein GCM10028810_68220 [Spirosoma litoris]